MRTKGWFWTCLWGRKCTSCVPTNWPRLGGFSPHFCTTLKAKGQVRHHTFTVPEAQKRLMSFWRKIILCTRADTNGKRIPPTQICKPPQKASCNKNIFFLRENKNICNFVKINSFWRSFVRKISNDLISHCKSEKNCITISLLKRKISPSVRPIYYCAGSHLEHFCPLNKIIPSTPDDDLDVCYYLLY